MTTLSTRAGPQPSRPAVNFDRRPMLVFWETTRARVLACCHCRASATTGAQPVAASGIKAVSISLDGAGPATYDGVRGIGGHFDATIAVLRDLVASGVTVQVNTTVMRANVTELADVAGLVAGTGSQIWEVFFLVHVGRGVAAGAISADEHESVCHFLYDASGYGFVVRTVEAPFFRRVVAERRAGCSPPGSALYAGLASRLEAVLGPPTRPPSAHTSPTRDGKGILFVAPRWRGLPGRVPAARPRQYPHQVAERHLPQRPRPAGHPRRAVHRALWPVRVRRSLRRLARPSVLRRRRPAR